jgi:hypothetical protein
MNKIVFSLLILFFSSITAIAQKGVTTLGIQLKPMVPSQFFGTGPIRQFSEHTDALLENQLGWNSGVVIRRGLNNMWSLETGIAMVQRNYKVSFESLRFGFSESMSYRLVGYEIPIQALIYVQLGKQWFMNGSGGMALNFYPSNLEKFGNTVVDTSFIDYHVKTYRNNWMMPSVLANLGFEYRTPKSGFFYIGASYHRPLSEIALSNLRIENNGSGNDTPFFLNGTYLTLDLRYFLPESSADKSKKKGT